MAENYRKTVYCEMQFLRECTSQLNMEDKINIQKLRLWECIKNLMTSQYVNLVLDISVDDFDSEIDNIRKRKYKARKTGNVQLGDYEELLWNIEYEQAISHHHLKLVGENFPDCTKCPNLNAIYLTSKDADICKEISCKYGVFVLSSKDFCLKRQQLEDAGCAIQKGDQTDWRTILDGKSDICNAMIIVDNYILSNTHELDENLRGIFDALLPESLPAHIPFNLSIFYCGDKRNPIPSKDRFQRVNELVRMLRPKLECEISIFKTFAFHDRTIITNNLWIGCGSGFNLFKDHKSSKMTVVNIISPYLTNTPQWSKKAYSNLMKGIRDVMRKMEEYQNDTYHDFYLGTGTNRLTE